MPERTLIERVIMGSSVVKRLGCEAFWSSFFLCRKDVLLLWLPHSLPSN